MKLKNVNFETWCKNHDKQHHDTVFRELYPWPIIRNIQFHESLIGQIQYFEFTGGHYEVVLRKIELQQNQKFRASFDFQTIYWDKTIEKWTTRTWTTRFQIVYTQDHNFITVFTKKRDPSKILVAKFMKGQFDKIVESKSVPVSELLYRSLISELTDQNYLGLDHYESFDVVRGGVRKTENGSYRFFKDTSFSPLFSLGRDLWIIHAFNEDKAHRLALTFSGQCKNMIAIYCNPTYTRHHRCHDKCVRVLSLYEYADSISPSLRLKYDFQIKLLHNYLNSAKLDSAEAIIQRISSMSTTDLEIEDPDIREALAVMRITVTSKYDAFYFFAAMNLLNAWSSRGAKKMVRKLFTNRYYFKDYVGEKIVHILEHRIEEVDICLDGDFAMISVMGFQFSFHYLPMNEKLSFYWSKGGNGYQEWSGIKLQPIAPLVFRLAKVYLKDYYSTLQKSKNGE